MLKLEDYNFLGCDACSLVEGAKGLTVSMITLLIKLLCDSL